MSRDGRGNPGRIVLKNSQPQLRLADVLRRRRSTLAAFISELGITTYTALEIWCKRMGVSSPSKEEFEVIFPPEVHINSPQEGVIVLEPPGYASDSTLDPEESSLDGALEHPSDTTKKPRKKKVLPTD